MLRNISLSTELWWGGTQNQRNVLPPSPRPGEKNCLPIKFQEYKAGWDRGKMIDQLAVE